LPRRKLSGSAYRPAAYAPPGDALGRRRPVNACILGPRGALMTGIGRNHHADTGVVRAPNPLAHKVRQAATGIAAKAFS